MATITTTTVSVTLATDLFERIQRVARARQTTVDEMFSSAAQTLGDLDFDPSTLPPITRSLLGLAREIPDRPYKELLLEALLDKYGTDK